MIFHDHPGQEQFVREFPVSDREELLRGGFLL